MYLILLMNTVDWDTGLSPYIVLFSKEPPQQLFFTPDICRINIKPPCMHTSHMIMKFQTRMRVDTVGSRKPGFSFRLRGIKINIATCRQQINKETSCNTLNEVNYMVPIDPHEETARTERNLSLFFCFILLCKFYIFHGKESEPLFCFPVTAKTLPP